MTIQSEQAKSTIKIDRPEVFLELTRSICPVCTRSIDAEVLARDNKIVMRKRCPQHGWFESMVFADADLYMKTARFNKPGTLPLEFATEVEFGCPDDCGLCPEHKQHACLGIIEVNTACNMDCPLCFANADLPGAKPGEHSYALTHQQVDYMLDSFIAAEGNPEVVMFSGGEPTIHPDILDFIEMANAKDPIKFVLLNTNGIRIARDDKFMARLAELKPHIYLQFDGFDEQTNLALRNRSDLVDEKIKALDRLAEAGLRAVLVMAVERDINQHEVGKVIQFGIDHPAVFGVTLQPAFHAGRFMPNDALERVTIPDVMRWIEEQVGQHFVYDDFVPIPCCFPTCNFVTYALVDHGHVTPLPRVMDVEHYIDYISNRAFIDLEIRAALEKLLSTSAVIGSEELAISFECAACNLGLGLPSEISQLADQLFMVIVKDFLDPYNFSQKTAMKCCVEVMVPDGRMIPFCTYNTVGYREQVRDAIAANPGAFGPGSLGDTRLVRPGNGVLKVNGSE